MVGNLHKLSAGDGYTYLTKQVAAMDSSERGTASLGDYYSMKGEAPGRWIGSGLSTLDGISVGDFVTEEQMKALYGNGRHPNAEKLETARMEELVGGYLQSYLDRGATMRTAVAKARDRAAKDALAVSRLGSPFKVYQQASPFRQAVAAAFSAYNVERGKPWNTALPSSERSRIRTEIALQMFTDRFGRAPLQDRELSGFIAANSRQQTQACAGYDFTVAAGGKSQHGFWALAPREMADTYFRCHVEAAEHAVRAFEEKAVFTRVGTNGVAQVDVHGVVATIFHHRDSRCGDPYLHSHIAISNKVQALDGRWLALDGRAMHKFAVWVSESYNTRMATLLRERLGVRTYERANQDPNKRGTLELVGFDWKLCEHWSSRNNSIEACRGELVREFQEQYGREPSPREAYALADRASMMTRPHKHEPRSEAEQRAAWFEEAVRVLGSERAVAEMIHAVTHPVPPDTEPPVGAELAAWIEVAADQVVTRVSQDRSTWQINHIGAEAERVVRAAELAPDLVADTIGKVIEAALAPARSIALTLPDQFDEPAALRRRDGTSVFVPVGTQSYTSTPILEAEERILAAADRRDGRYATASAVELALLEYHANNPDKPLEVDQTALVRAFATSGARVELALAPAGTGKTTAMRVFTRAWQNDGGSIIGLAPTAAAAAVLREETGTVCDTIDKLTFSLDQARVAAENGAVASVPDWVNGIDDRTIVIVDEAALASTNQLDQVISYVLDRGGSVRLIGDDKQLASVSAGGIVRAIADTYGAHTLGHVVRFRDADGNPRRDEGAASLALREGDPAAIAFYLDHGRVHAGDLAALLDTAYTRWDADQRAGMDSVMMAPTRAITRDLNARARTDRLAGSGPAGPEITLHDGTKVSAGDLIRTTMNKRRLTLSDTDWVRNGYRWMVDKVHQNGALSVTQLRTKLSITLPSWYVQEFVLLGYAATIQTSQGITAATSHTVFSGNESCNDVYTAVTRGSRANDVYCPTALTGDEHSVVSDRAMNPVTVVDFLTRMITTDGSQKAATTLTRELNDPNVRLAQAVEAYIYAVGAAAESTLGHHEMRRIDQAADSMRAGLTDEAAWPTLRKHLAVLAVSGTDPVRALSAAHAARELDSSRDAAAVLDWRLDETGNHAAGQGPLPWLTGIPRALDAHPGFGEYLRARADLIANLAASIATGTTHWDLATAPHWARPLLGGDHSHELLADIAVWRAALAVAPTDRRVTGPDRFATRELRYQSHLTDEIAALLGNPNRPVARWRSLADTLDPRLVLDPYWPIVAERLTAADRAGIDVHALTKSLAAERPLPSELPAAVLWWRLARHLPDIAKRTSSANPDWLPLLRARLGTALADRMTTTQTWHDLITAVDDATELWQPTHLFELALATLQDHASLHHISPEQLAAMLAARIRSLHSAVPELAPEDIPTAEEPAVEDHVPPDPAADFEIPMQNTRFNRVGPDEEPVDQDYLAAVAGYSPRDVDTGQHDGPNEVLIDWDIAAAAVPPLPYPDLDPDSRVTALRADLTTARTAASQLWTAYLAGKGQHRQRTAALLATLQRRADAQTPYRIAALEAHEVRLAADRRSTSAAHALVDHLRAAAVHSEADSTNADMTDLDTTILRLEADSAGAAATSAHADADAAQREWEQFAQDEGIVTPEQVDTTRAAADDLDLEAVLAARREVEVLENHLVRAENAAAHAALCDELDDALDGLIRASEVDAPPATLLTRTTTPRRVLETAAEIAARLLANRLQMLTHSALVEEIRSTTTQLTRDRQALKRAASSLSPTGVADRLRAEHAKLRDQATAITTARVARTTAARTGDELHRATDDLAALISRRDSGAVRGRRERAVLDTEITVAKTRVSALHDRHTSDKADARTAEDIAAHLASPLQWDSIIARVADEPRLADELDAAAAEDASRTERLESRRAEIDTRIAELGAALEAALDEQQRREALDEGSRAEEERIRAQYSPVGAPPTPATEKRVPPTTPPRRTRRTSRPSDTDTQHRRGPAHGL